MDKKKKEEKKQGIESREVDESYRSERVLVPGCVRRGLEKKKMMKRMTGSGKDGYYGYSYPRERSRKPAGGASLLEWTICYLLDE